MSTRGIRNELEWLDINYTGLDMFDVDDLHTANPEARALWAGILHECRELHPLVQELLGLLEQDAARASIQAGPQPRGYVA